MHRLRSILLRHLLVLADCTWEFARLRRDQGRREDAAVCYESAQRGFEVMDLAGPAASCKADADLMRSTKD